MKDETFCYMEDVKEKSITARSARNRSTHGGVMLPCDTMTRKELEAMNGEVKTYRLSEPMRWAEFKTMPDELKVQYIEFIRDKFGVSDTCISKMFCISQKSVSTEMQRLGIAKGTSRGTVRRHLDEFFEWCGLAHTQPAEKPEPQNAAAEKLADAMKTLGNLEPVGTIPESGSLTFDGSAADALRTVCAILKNAKVQMHVGWKIIDERTGCNAEAEEVEQA